MYLFLPAKQKLCTDVRDSSSVNVRKLSELIGNLTSFNTSSISSPTPLSVSSHGKQSKTLSENRLKFRSVSKQRGNERIKRVDLSFRKMEWENLNFFPSDMYNSIGRQQTVMGGRTRMRSNRGSLVRTRETIHIRFKNSCGNSCCKIVLKKGNKINCLSSDRQHKLQSNTSTKWGGGHTINAESSFTKIQESLGRRSFSEIFDISTRKCRIRSENYIKKH